MENKQITAKVKNQYPAIQGRVPLVTTFADNKPIYKDWDTERANKYGLQASAWVYSCVRKLSTSTSSVPWIVERRTRKGRWERDVGHPIELLMNRPNKFMTGQDLIEILTHHLYLGGNGIWHPVSVDGVPVELWPLMPDLIAPIPDAKEFIKGYEYKIGGHEPIKLKPEEVIHFKFANPGNFFWGLSPLMAVSKIVDTDVEAVNWNKVSLQRRGVPDGVFTVSAAGATRDQWIQAREQVREQYLGKGREPWVVFNVDYKQMALTPIEMDFLNSRKFAREEICSVYGVLPILIGAMEDAHYNAIGQAKRIFWEDTVVPYLDDIKDALNVTLLPHFDPEALKPSGDSKYRINYDISNVPALQENFSKKVASAKVLFEMGFPIKQINSRLELGFEDTEIPDVATAPRGVGEDGSRRTGTEQSPEGANPKKGAFVQKVAEKMFKQLERDREVAVEIWTREGKEKALAYIEQGKNNWTPLFRGVCKASHEIFGTETVSPDNLSAMLCKAIALKVQPLETPREVNLFYSLKAKDIAERLANKLMEGGSEPQGDYDE